MRAMRLNKKPPDDPAAFLRITMMPIDEALR